MVGCPLPVFLAQLPGVGKSMSGLEGSGRAERGQYLFLGLPPPPFQPLNVARPVCVRF